MKLSHSVLFVPCHCCLLSVRKHLPCGLKGTNSGQLYSKPSFGLLPPC